MRSATLSSCALLLLVLSFGLHNQHVDGANILGLFLSHSPSHLIVHMSVVKALAEKGHNVTVVTALKPKVTHENITNIVIGPTAEQEEEFNQLMNVMAEKDMHVINMMIIAMSSMKVMTDMQADILRDERFTALYDQKDTKFDLVIMGFFFNEFVTGVAGKFNVPMIVDWTASINDFVNSYVGNPFEWSYVPNMNMGIKAGYSMTFAERVQSFFGSSLFQVMSYFLRNQWKATYNELFPDKNFPSFEDMKKNISLVFVNSHFSEGPIRPNVPAMVEIGGIQIKDKPNPLPKNIADHLNAAKKHGAILFCLGSNIKSSNVKPEAVAKIFKVLSGLKQNVVWKWDDLDNLPGKSDNILYIKWLPQDDILAHPNLKLFITHAGKGGIAESQYHAVPMVALPIFGDQPGNADAMVASGYGLQVNIKQLEEKELKDAIVEVLSNDIYKKNVERFSKLYRDRPMTAKETAVYWTEYVLRHHGAAHMQSPLVHMNAFQEANLDVIGVIVGALAIVLGTFCLIIKLICAKCCKSKKGYKKVKKH